MSEPVYSYRVITSPVFKHTIAVSQVRAAEPLALSVALIYGDHAPLDFGCATYHTLKGLEGLPGDRDPVGLIELEDGSVVVQEDIFAQWDPVESPFVSAMSGILEPAAPGTVLAAAESKFFARQLAEIDRSVYAAKYPVYSTSRAALLSTVEPHVSTHAVPVWRQRLRAWFGALRHRVGLWIAGVSLADDDCDEDDY